MTSDVRYVNDSFAELSERAGKYEGRYDVLITDPPYDEHTQANMCSGSLVGTKNVPKYDLDFAPLKSYEWLRDAMACVRRWSLVFCPLETFGKIEMLMGRPAYVRGGVWYKPNAMGQLTGDRPATSYEGITMLHPEAPKKRWNGHGSYGIWKCNSTRGKEGRHPNEKPLDLCLKLVALFSERGETVFDPFAGSGAVGEACVLLGRSYVGWDNDGAWVVAANSRLVETERSLADGTRMPYSDEEALALCRMTDGPAPARKTYTPKKRTKEIFSLDD